jgi:hypothetical protein
MPPSAPEYWRAPPTASVDDFSSPRLVHHQYRLVIGELTGDPAGRPVAHGIVVPHRTGQEVLKTVRSKAS